MNDRRHCHGTRIWADDRRAWLLEAAESPIHKGFSPPKKSESTGESGLEGFIQDRVEPGSTVYTDDHGGYNRLWMDFNHASVRHSVREYVSGPSPHQRD